MRALRALVASVALVALAGCDSVFGLSGRPSPCAVPGFDGAPSTVIAPAIAANDTGVELFSVSWDESLAIVSYASSPYEIALPGGAPAAIDLGIYPSEQYALVPEGDELLYSASEEPPILQLARRTGAGQWSLGGSVPAGAFAGTPSAAEFGPRRVLVRLQFGGTDVQEYELDGARWVAVGPAHPVDGGYAPNLTPDGLVMSYDSAGTTFAATRATVAEWFGMPAPTSTGGHAQPQLLDNCHHLYTLDSDGAVRRYDR